jgi:multiple sugar transport system permease protein
LENFQSLFTGLTGASTGSSTVDFLRNFANSLVISFGAVVISVFVGVPATYAIARFNFKGKEDLAFTILSFRFAPELMVIIPIYIFFQRLGLLDTYTGLIWVYQLITLPMIVWILRGYIEDVSRELEEACWLDGYGRVHTFWRIVLPLIRPGIAASGLLAFIYAWNNFVFAVLLGGSRTAPVTVGAMQFISADALRYGDMAAAIVLAAIPALILALYAQKHLIRGLSLGAVKA